MLALALALAPASLAGASEHLPSEPRSTAEACPEDSYENPFTDVSAANTHVENLLCAADHGIAQGFPDDTYRPAGPVYRDQLASFVVRWLELELDELPVGDHRFDDVSTASPHYEAVHALAEVGVVRGVTESAFHPRRVISRAETATLVDRAVSFAHDGDPDSGDVPPRADPGDYFTDVRSGGTHAGAIDALAGQAVLLGYGEHTYGPDDHVRRDQMASILMRAYALLLSELGPTEPDDTIQDAEVLYFSDEEVGEDRVLTGLEDLVDDGIIELTVAESREDARDGMQEDHDVLVYFNQANGLGTEDVDAIVDWIDAGNPTVFADWAHNAQVLSALETASTGNDNQQPLTFLDDRLLEGVQDPMPLTDPGWGTWSMGLEPVDDAVSVCEFPNGDSCLVYGNDGQTVTVGFLNDTVEEDDGRNFTRNLLRIVIEGEVLDG